MKKIIQLALLCIVIISIFIFSKMYFSKNEKNIVDLDVPSDQLDQQTENNIIYIEKEDLELAVNKIIKEKSLDVVIENTVIPKINARKLSFFDIFTCKDASLQRFKG